MTLDIAYWRGLGDQLGWMPQYRDPAYNTSDNDSNPRERGYVDYFIIHHTATTNEALAVDLMQPGGRLVTAQWVLCTDGKYRPIIYLDRRAYTSSSWLDDIADTVETVNASGGPEWQIADVQKMALALMAVWKYRTGRLRALTRSYIVGHYEVLGISGSGYDTSCPGPDMQLDLIVELAQAIYSGALGPVASTKTKGRRTRMFTFIRNKTDGSIMLINGEKATYRGLRGGEWAGYAANGWKYADLSANDFRAALEVLTPED